MNPTTDQPPPPPPQQPPLQPHRSSFSCDRHPTEQFTGFCPSCLCERLTSLDQSSASSSRRPSNASAAPSSTAASALKAIFRVPISSTTTDNNCIKGKSKPSSSASFFPELRRTKSFSASKNEGFSGVFEPQRRSCDVRARSTLWSLFTIDDERKSTNKNDQSVEVETRNVTGPVLESKEEEDEHGDPVEEVEEEDDDGDEIRVSEEIVEEEIVEEQQEEEIKKEKRREKPKGKGEMKTEMKIKPYHLRFSSVLILMISLHFCICGAALAKKSNSMISGECNSTIAECLADERAGEEEFLMESETIRRLLDPRSNHISLATQVKGPVCNTRQYSDCIGQANNYKRPCDTYNRCKHNPNPK